MCVLDPMKYADSALLTDMTNGNNRIASCLYEVCDRVDIYHLNRDTIVLLLAPVGSQYNEDVSHSQMFFRRLRHVEIQLGPGPRKIWVTYVGKHVSRFFYMILVI